MDSEHDTSIEKVEAPIEVDYDAIIAMCPHEPRTQWFDTHKGIVSQTEDGTDVVVDYVAVCDACCTAGLDSVEWVLAQREIEAKA